MEKIKKATGLSIAGLVLGITSLVLFWVPGVHFITGILAIVFGAITTSRKDKFGLAGLITGIIGFIIVGIIFGWAFMVGFNEGLNGL